MGDLRFYVDESLMGLGKALSSARTDTVYPSHPRFPQVRLGAEDEQWIPIVATAGLIAIIRDRKVFTRWWENDLIIRHRLRLIHIAVKRDLSNWENLRLLVRHWDRIEEVVERDEPPPWRLKVLQNGVELVPVAATKVTGKRPVRG
ncbi:MAG TPA: hypothetical protein VFR11_13110 [Micromonosporaceae bacterium]|jgi:hypothetical protein|nr:hypothetical protein [Micromonosporaceae bacterium]